MLPIYCEHFGLKREPFNITPDPSFLYLSESHREALAQLVYGIRSRRGFVVLTGEVGTGKTTLVQCLLEEISNTTRTALVFNMIASPKDLFRYICEKFGIVATQESIKDIHDYVGLLEEFLIDRFRSGENVAVILDEAQNLSTEVLENVRLLSNFETAREKLLQILLVGQPELGNRLNTPELRQIKQRVALRHHLSALNFDECKEYIKRRLEIAGGALSLFSADALVVVHDFANGIPRLVNILCDNGLLAAYASRKPSVDTEMIKEIARDLQLTSVRPRFVSRETKSNGLINSRSMEARDTSAEMSLKIVDEIPHTSRKESPPLSTQSSTARIQKEKTITANPDAMLNRVFEKPETPSVSSNSVPGCFFEHMTRALTEAMGPMAPLVVQEQVAAMGESIQSFPKDRLLQLIDKASSEILGEPSRLSFQRRMSEEIRGIGAGE